MDKAQQLANVRTLKKYLEGLTPDQLVLGDWVMKAGAGIGGCGAVACIAGHACMVPDLRKQGLRYSFEKREEDDLLSDKTVLEMHEGTGLAEPVLQLEDGKFAYTYLAALFLFDDAELFRPASDHPLDELYLDERGLLSPPTDMELALNRLEKLEQRLAAEVGS